MSSARHNYLHIFVFIDSFFLLDAIRPVPSGTYDFEGEFCVLHPGHDNDVSTHQFSTIEQYILSSLLYEESIRAWRNFSISIEPTWHIRR